MLPGVYSAASTFRHNQRQLDLVNNNLSNSDTPGFRESLMLVKARQDQYNQWGIDHFSKQGQSIPYATEQQGIYKNHAQTGVLKETKNPFDLAILPEIKNAFFRVKESVGSAESFFTRNGTLSVQPQDPNVPNSPPILYINGYIAIDEQGAPIRIDPTLGPMTIEPSGEIAQGTVNVGKIPLYRMNTTPSPLSQTSADLHKLEALGNSLYRIPKQYKSEIFPLAIQGRNKLMEQGKQEGSNVNIIKEMARLTFLTKHTESLRGVTKAQLDGLSRLFQVIRS